MSLAHGAEAEVTHSGRVQPEVALVDLLDRLLGAGVVISGDVTISLSGVDLVQIRLHALITSVRAEMAQAGR
ncbi:gas vesicle protein [Nocardioides sp.]|uniref:gas vesicle protein n=1 Tax=Nocardioides sp. TaxID=35761 RepID=UPI002D8101EB|nr:gas vesicle protein [Nocardioides sp.]HET8960256.1 gas vesicle protein [Nocardioides sp.]